MNSNGDSMTKEITEILDQPSGTMLIYHVGLLSKDRGDVNRTSEEQRVNETACIAWKLHERGIVHLVQRRLGYEMYEYIAIRSSGRSMAAPRKVAA